jgi:carbon-monoxide dehydrogenase large subunit
MEAALAKARPIAAQMLQADEDNIVFTDGEFRVRNTGQSVRLLDVAAAARDLKVSGGRGLDSYERRDDAPFTFPSGCHVAEVEIDQDTGLLLLVRYLSVDDYGRLINPRLTEGQVHGGLVQGIGQALFEDVIYDPKTGQLLNGTWMDYAMPHADQIPSFEIQFRQTPTSANPLGVKGAGQAGCMAAPQTIMSAVLDALKPLDITDMDMPVTPERLWRSIRDAL